MDPLSITASIIAILEFTTTLVKYASDVKDAPKDRARFAVEAHSLSGLLLTLRYQIDAKSDEEWYREVILLGVPGGPLDQYKHALKELQHKVLSVKGLAKIREALKWKFSKEEVASILLRIERLKSLIQIALQMDHVKLSQAIKTSLDEIYVNSEELKLDIGVVRSQIPAIQGSVIAVQDSVEAVQQHQDRQKNQALVEWISSAKYSSQQSDFIASRQTGTGQWFLDSPEFNNWLDGSSRTLFCPGIPGAGKTMISAIAIDHLHKVAYSDRCGVAHVFCNYKSQSEQNTTSILSAILKQLVQANPSAAEAASSLYQRHCHLGTRPSLDDIFGALKTAMKTFIKVYVVVDALDECSDRDGTRGQLLAKLRDLQHGFDLRLMVTSRSSPDIVNQFKSLPMLEVRASAADVRRFVRGQIHLLPKCVQHEDILQKKVEDKIVEVVDGMFLLARLHVESLRDKRTKAKVQTMLETLPRGSGALKEAYNDAIKRIEAQSADDSKLAKAVLSWITYAERPLTTDELCHALAVDPDDADLDEDNIPDADDIASLCAGLVTIDEESNIIRLVHYTTQDYFVQIRQDWNPTAERDITTTCLSYLSFDPFRGGSCDTDVAFKVRITNYKFLEYASMYWGDHAQTVQEQVSELAFPFLRDSKLVSCAMQTFWAPKFELSKSSQTFPRYATGVHLTAMFGLQYLLAGLLSGSGRASRMPADSRDTHGWTPLSWAAYQGHEKVVKLLVERDDVEVNSKDMTSRTPLSRATERGHEAAVKQLLEREGIDADDKEWPSGRTPLSWASQKGHMAIAELLIGREDVRIEAKDSNGTTAFSFAVEGGFEATVKMFLERKDVDFNSVDRYGAMPLSLAARRGHEAIVKLLLENEDIKAKVDERDMHGWTPLSCAAQMGNEATVKLLVEQDNVDATSKDNQGRTPLWWAARLGKESVMKLLLGRDDSKTNLNLTDADGWTLLSWAVQEGHQGIVKLLVERKDVEANLKDECGKTPLLWAAQLGNKSAVGLLVGREDVDGNVKDRKGQTPLSWAAQRGHEAVVKLLLEWEGIEADEKDADGRTPLYWAAQLGNESVVKLLLGQPDVNASSRNKSGQTALMWAAEAGHEGIVKLLMERENVDADSKDDDGKTPLMCAAYQGHETIVKLLLEKNVDPTTKTNVGQTPLSLAALRGHIGIVELLRLKLERSGAREDGDDESRKGNESQV